MSDPLPPEDARRVDQACNRFERAWREGTPRIEDFLDGLGEPGRSALLRELVLLDIDYRRRRDLTLQAEDYARFAELDATWLANALAETSGLTSRGDTSANGATTSHCPPSKVGCVADYELGEEVGGGGMGVIYRARDLGLDRDLAVKVLRPEHHGRPELVRRFLAEARVVGRLQHPAIPPVHGHGQLPDGRPFFTMKLILGETLEDLLRARPHPSEDLPRFLGIFEQVCQAVAYAHSRGILHRDLKPHNVMVGAFGEVQLLDWGLAKELKRGAEGKATAPPLIALARTKTEGVASGEMMDAGAPEEDAAWPQQTQMGQALGTLAVQRYRDRTVECLSRFLRLGRRFFRVLTTTGRRCLATQAARLRLW